jgi:hypothetical protein
MSDKLNNNNSMKNSSVSLQTAEQENKNGNNDRG